MNAFNRVTNREELYFTLFKPQLTELWAGNVKRFMLGQDSNGKFEIQDSSGDPAVDPQTGFFAATATSVWTNADDAPDGAETRLGGAAREFTTTRTIYTYMGVTDDLSDSTNRIQTTNTNITDGKLGLLGATGEPTRIDLIKWRAGLDLLDQDADGADDDARQFMADPLHTKPVLVTYGTTQANPDITLFMATNEGIVHAIDVEDGSEVFSYVPPEHLLNTLRFFNNDNTGSKGYALDGTVSVFHRDINGDGILQPTDGDRYILIVGERRGGSHYYALDITNRSTPKFLWTIKGGFGGTVTGAGDYYEMAQTWSSANFAKVRVTSGGNLVVRDVMVVGGGYDTDHDTTGGTRNADDMGRAVYMIDVYSGKILWWAGRQGITDATSTSTRTPDLAFSDMNYAIAGDIRTIDFNGDGFHDRLYFADLGGQVWRIDLNNFTNTGPGNFADGYRVADLQKTSASSTLLAENNRRFFYTPDIGLILDESNAFITISIGSGYRAHPLDSDVKDRFYMIKDFFPFETPTTFPSVLYEGDLTDVTTDLSPTSVTNGWFIQLADFGETPMSVGTFVGEKVLSESFTINNQVLFTTFKPVATASSAACAPNQGTGNVYAISLTDGSPGNDLDQVTSGSSFTRSDRSLTLTRTGIAPEVTVLFPPVAGANPVSLVAAELVELGITSKVQRTYWYEQEDSGTSPGQSI
ncbi:MAG: hypothetical protein HOI95_25410 [Chromatiales bacterium]|nr:hypothetical protein [Chromatiales bacterium]